MTTASPTIVHNKHSELKRDILFPTTTDQKVVVICQERRVNCKLASMTKGDKMYTMQSIR